MIGLYMLNGCFITGDLVEEDVTKLVLETCIVYYKDEMPERYEHLYVHKSEIAVKVNID